MKNVNVSLRKEIIRRLVDEFDPEAIYLFGSYAWGRPEEDSDLDLMVIVQESQQAPVQRAVRAYRSLRDLRVPIDILVKTRVEFDRYRPVHASLEAQIAEKGILLYGSQTRPGEKLADYRPA